MKATSLIFDSVQRPQTIFGLPFKLASLVGVCIMFAFTLLMQVGAPMTLAMFGLLAAFPAGVLWCWRMRAKDHHIETVFPATRRFWRGKKTTLTLLAGNPPRQKKTKGKAGNTLRNILKRRPAP